MNGSIDMIKRIIDQASQHRYTDEEIEKVLLMDRSELSRWYHLSKEKQLKDLTDEERLILSTCIALDVY